MLPFDWLLALSLKPTPSSLRPPKPVHRAPVQADAHAEVHAYLRLATSRATADKLTAPLVAAARRHRLPPVLVARLVVRESGGNAKAVNGWCVGLMQVDRRLWFKASERPFSVGDNLEAGCRLLARLKRRYPTWEQALTAYNFGENHHVTRRLATSRYARAILAR
jgi:soluble lytic murein transglycosylase-like protein